MTFPSRPRIGSADRGTFGCWATQALLIPPSIMMIVYGVAAQVSINRLFIAGILPGLMLMGLFSAYIAIRSLLSGEGRATNVEEDETDKIGKLKALSLLAPTTLLIGFVIGSIYGGFATATEAAAVGVLGALVISTLSGALTRESFLQSISGALHTTAMIGLILIGAAFLTKAMSFTGLPAAITSLVVALHASPTLFLVLMTLVFIVLGFFLDGISIIVLTSSVILPAVMQLGIDPIWFGIYLIIVVEMAQITPPLGINLFVIQAMTGHDIFKITRMTLPFFFLLLLAIVLFALFPGIATWLVDLKYN